jgi:hypothetical protein
MRQFLHKYFKLRQRFDNATEKLFQVDYIQKSLFSIRFGLILAMFLYGSFGFLDLWIVPYTKHIAWFIRFAIVVPLLLLVYIFSFHGNFKKFNQLIISTLVLILGLGIVAMIAVSKPEELGFKYYYVGLILVIFAGYTFLRLQFWYAIIPSVLIGIGYEFVAIYFQKLFTGNIDDPGMQIFVNNNFFFISANIIGLSASYSLEVLFRNEFTQNLKIENEKQEVIKFNNILHQKNHEIEAQRDEIEAQKNEILNQHEVLINQKKELTDSIIYARRIQTAMLPSLSMFNELYPDNFIFYKPVYKK